jgi:hypothetical protein
VAAPAAEPAARTRLERGTADELMKTATSDLTRVHRALKEVLSRVQDARDEKDLVKLLCADEKLSRLKVLVSVAEKADVALAEAVANKDPGAEIESSKIAVARGKADALRAEAAGCIGQLAYEVTGKTSVVVEEAAELPDIGNPEAATNPFSGADPYRHEFGIPSDARR